MEKEVDFADLAQHGDDYEVTLHVNNPSTQELTAFFEWQLPNERWSVRPLKGLRVVLPAGTKEFRSPLRCTAGFHTRPRLTPPASPGPCI